MNPGVWVTAATQLVIQKTLRWKTGDYVHWFEDLVVRHDFFGSFAVLVVPR